MAQLHESHGDKTFDDLAQTQLCTMLAPVRSVPALHDAALPSEERFTCWQFPALAGGIHAVRTRSPAGYPHALHQCAAAARVADSTPCSLLRASTGLKLALEIQGGVQGLAGLELCWGWQRDSAWENVSMQQPGGNMGVANGSRCASVGAVTDAFLEQEWFFGG
ncbi:hypothetical protein CYMTET_9625 [Cymbomonas tetramitiformis]|uniref:Uncharacterized protein n=1 Tax=Cymbomonas tetramitiformis TaxID=36881 RepID=A0AAE0LEU7_9CHLO|nr:hypothetical protein CYMTET_9625 [Cymbomonas tetramitiformis]